MSARKRLGGCRVCHHPKPNFTSSYDGRPKAVCPRCGNEWTCNKKPNEGYKPKKKRN